MRTDRTKKGAQDQPGRLPLVLTSSAGIIISDSDGNGKTNRMEVSVMLHVLAVIAIFILGGLLLGGIIYLIITGGDYDD